MQISVIVSFIVIFALVLACVGLGMKYFEARRKKHVTGMLETVAGQPAITISNILREELDPNQSVVERVLTRFNFSDKARSELQQAGMPWSPSKLVAIMGVGAIGVVIGLIFPLISERRRHRAASQRGSVSLFFFVHHKRQARMDKFEEQFPEALDFLSRSMRRPRLHHQPEMLGDEIADPLGEFRTLFNEQNLGAPMEVALRNLWRVPLPMSALSSSVLLKNRPVATGKILSRLAHVNRERSAEGTGQGGQCSRATYRAILTVPPIATMCGQLIIAPGYLQGMAADPDGKWLIVGHCVWVIGNIIRKINNIRFDGRIWH
jgi:tight adherence protein B